MVHINYIHTIYTLKEVLFMKEMVATKLRTEFIGDISFLIIGLTLGLLIQLIF